ncbi:cytochrome P450, partial [Klebsiella pneumoniae]|nr:cytochrome P450 [Klebsiella pneumoniae]
LEEWVTEEAGCLSAAFADLEGRPFSPHTLLNKAVCNVISSLTFARRFTYEDPYFIRMLKVMNESLQDVSGFIPEKAITAMVNELLTEHKMTWVPTQPQ